MDEWMDEWCCLTRLPEQTNYTKPAAKGAATFLLLVTLLSVLLFLVKYFLFDNNLETSEYMYFKYLLLTFMGIYWQLELAVEYCKNDCF